MNTENNLTPTNTNSTIADTIKRFGIAKIEVTFDGCGDSGQIEGICAVNANGDEFDFGLDNDQESDAPAKLTDSDDQLPESTE
jgi:hypothetical protein